MLFNFNGISGSPYPQRSGLEYLTLQSWVLSKGAILHKRKAQATPTCRVPPEKSGLSATAANYQLLPSEIVDNIPKIGTI